MAVVRLVCWKEDLAEQRAKLLEEAGYAVDASPLVHSGIIGQFRANTPAAVVIDLDRLPSHGRELAIALRQSKTTRQIPLVFAGGQPDRVEKIKRELPDARFADWIQVPHVLRESMENPIAHPVKPPGAMERYAESSLIKKLGIAANWKVALLGAPPEFANALGEVPDGVEWQTAVERHTDLVIWFVRSRRELEEEIEFIAAWLPAGASVWIVHPKQSGGYRSDFNQNDVRAAGLTANLVDYKVCSVDENWSGLKFARKKT